MKNSKNSLTAGLLNYIQRAGNRLPHPTVLFIWLAVFIVLLSWFLEALAVSAVHPVSGKSFAVESLLTNENVLNMFTKAVSNFTGFAPVGVVLVVMLGLGVAEHSGLIGCALKGLVRKTSNTALAYVTAFAGVISSIGADVGYVVLIPIAAMIYHAANRPALAGIAVAFAGVSAGFSANLVIGPVDVMLAGISTEAARLADSNASVTATDNYYFIIASTFLITLVCGWLSNRFVEPALTLAATTEQKQVSPIENSKSSNSRALQWVGLFTALFAGLLMWMTLSSNGVFHSNSVSSSPLLKSLVPIIALYFALAGYLFGRVSGSYQSAANAITGMENAMKTMAYYIVLMFFAAQFVNYFSWSNIGIVAAINGANWLGQTQLSTVTLLVGIIVFAAFINLFVGSASAKWTLLAPVFIPMLMLLGIAPEQTQLAYRIGDSTTNIITPLMPYFGIVLAYAQKYQPELGLGDVIAMMLPYSITLLIFWSALFALWLGLGIPLGP
jgi:aminobenzoyl-glutamate transport protein